MSALHPELHSALGQLLQGLNSPDNELRSKYEDSLANEWQTQKPDSLLMGLVEHAHSAQDEKVCCEIPPTTSIIYLRNTVTIVSCGHL